MTQLLRRITGKFLPSPAFYFIGNGYKGDDYVEKLR